MLLLRLGGEKDGLICGYVLTLASLISYTLGLLCGYPWVRKTQKLFLPVSAKFAYG